jgi:hypothetical protein
MSRITEAVNTSVRFGFLYTTTRSHVEEGQERFVIEYDMASGHVWYLIEAVSRPRHFLARIAYPYFRAMQHRAVHEDSEDSALLVWIRASRTGRMGKSQRRGQFLCQSIRSLRS